MTTHGLRVRVVTAAFLVAVMLGGLRAQGQKTGEQGDGGRQSTPAAQSPEANKQVGDENEGYRHSAIVEKLGGMLGMSTDRAATVFEVANFAVLAFVVGGFLVKTLPRTFRDRTSLIQKQLGDARTATEEAGARLRHVEDRLSNLDAQIASMRTQSDMDSTADERRMKVTMQEETGRILASAEQEISAATVQAQQQLQRYAAELAVERAAKQFIVSDEVDRQLVQSFVQRLSSDGPKGEN